MKGLYTSYGEGPGSPAAFYERLGFKPTGGRMGDDDDEIEVVLGFS